MSAVLLSEILYRTFELLSTDKSTLESCTLVSHRWHALARPHLFALLLVNGPQKLSQIVHTHPSIGGWIKELIFQQLKPGGELLSHDMYSVITIDFSDLLSVLPSLPTLRILKMTRVKVIGDISTDALAKEHKLPVVALRLLEIFNFQQQEPGNGVFNTLAALLSIIAVDTLRIINTSTSGSMPLWQPPLDSRYAAAIRRIQVTSGSSQPDYWDFFKNILRPDALRAVTMQYSNLSDRHGHSMLDGARFLCTPAAQFIESLCLDTSHFFLSDSLPREYS
ncbi:hypothetical protein C8Q80DRAFT_949342 [Daedaleopsis nitida]|nr:hypothetical protein C8Q80DRAFT_949342 [Daedaleopsis nitida]